MRIFNVLFLGGSKRINLVKNFKRIGPKFKCKINCFSYELDKNNVFFLVGKVLIGKKWSDPYIIQDLKNKIKKNNIHLILANTDPATLILSKLKEDKFCKDKLITSNLKYSTICYDKLKIDKVLSKSKKILVIPRNSQKYPKFIKPRFGSGSLLSKKINNKKELTKIKRILKTKNFLIQDYISGKEITVDVYTNKFGKYIASVCRNRIVVSHGESIVTETFLDKKLEEQVIIILKILKNSLIGPLTFQFIKNKDRYFFLEINPRLSGGINASISSGLNVPSYIMSDLFNKNISKIRFKKRKLFKYFKEVIT